MTRNNPHHHRHRRDGPGLLQLFSRVLAGASLGVSLQTDNDALSARRGLSSSLFDDIRVELSRDAAAALAFARQHSVAAVVTRILQAGSVDGVALARALKEDEQTRRIPVIVITSQSQAAVRTEAEKAGCDRFLLLPCRPDQLVAEIRRFTNAGNTAPQS